MLFFKKKSACFYGTFRKELGFFKQPERDSWWKIVTKKQFILPAENLPNRVTTIIQKIAAEFENLPLLTKPQRSESYLEPFSEDR